MTDADYTWNGQHSFLLEYADKILKGEIPAGELLKRELALLQQNILQAEFEFNLDEPQKRIRFIETELRHTERPFAGKPFTLMLFQKAFIEAVYGFYVRDRDTGKRIRRFKRVLLVVGKKNGKTPLIAGLVLSEFYCGPMGTRIMIGSNDYEQASLMFDHVNNMREDSPKLNKTSHKNQKGIFMGGFRSKKLYGKYSKQNKAWIKKISAKTRTLDGRNLAMGAMDEIWQLEQQNPEIVSSMQQAVGTQDESLYVEITTEGTVNDGYLDKVMTYADAVLNGEIQDDRFLPWIYKQDSEEEIYLDEKIWVKSNPGLGTVKNLSYLREEVEKARRSAADRPLILCKEFNIKQNLASAWMTLETVINEEHFDAEEFRNSYYVGGLDMAETTDLNAIKLIFMHAGSRKKYCFSHYWIPESKADAILEGGNTNPEKKNYREWEQQGLITIVEGNMVDTAIIADWLFEMMERYQFKPFKIGYDNKFSEQFVKRFNALFGEKFEHLVLVWQIARVLSSPMREFEQDMQEKLFVYNSNPIDRWCFLNTAIKTDKEGYIKPAKVLGRAGLRIDGTAAAIDAYAVLGWNKAEFESLLN